MALGPDKRAGWWLGLAVTVAALAVYLATLAPTLTFQHYGADGGDLIAAAHTLGVPHPPGYPTYTVLAWLASHLPIGNIAYRVNLLSAICAAGSVGLLCMTTQVLLASHRASRLVACSAALTLGFSSLLWSQAVIGEVYAPLMLFASLFLFLLVRWRAGGSDTTLWLAAFCLGTGLGVHLTLAFALPPAIALLWTQRQRWLRSRTLLPALALFVAGLGVYAYLPLAASHHPPVNWGDPDRWDRFVWVISGRLYQPLVLGLPPGERVARLGSWARLVGNQFGWWGLAIAFLGAPVWWKRDRSLALFGLLWASLTAVYAFFYDSADSFVYLLPAMLLLAVSWSQGGRYLLDVAGNLRPWAQPAASAILLLLPAGSLALHWSEADLGGDWSAQAYVDRVLASIAPNGLVLAQSEMPTFGLWYAQYTDGQRPDIAVVNTSLLGFDWYRAQLRGTYPQLEVPDPLAEAANVDDQVRELVVRNYLRHPAYATDPSDAWKAWCDVVQEGGGSVYRIQIKAKWEPAR